MCCTPAVPELGKPAGPLCQHCTGKGCAIYADRPGSCRRFFCLWAAGPQLAGALRPDICGAFFEPVRGKPVMLVNVDPKRPDVWQHGIVKGLIDRFVAQGTAVAIVVGDHNHFRLPPGMPFVPVWRAILDAAKAAGVR